MAPALLAVLPLTHRSLLKHADMLRTGCDPHGIRLPERKGIDRSSRPRTAGLAMTIAHDFRLAGDLDLNGTAKTLPVMCCHRR
jgi:hypothetical protein